MLGAIDVGNIEVVVLGHGGSVVLGCGTVVPPGGRVVGGNVVVENDVLDEAAISPRRAESPRGGQRDEYVGSTSATPASVARDRRPEVAEHGACVGDGDTRVGPCDRLQHEAQRNSSVGLRRAGGGAGEE